MANASTSSLKAALRITAAITFYDTRLTSCASAANKYVLSRVRQTSLAVSTATEYPAVYSPSQTMIVLRRRPVVGIAVVTDAGSVLAATAYRYDAENGLLYRTDGSYWSNALDGVQVHYGAGYDSTTVPEDLVEAANLIGVAMFNRGALAGLESQDDGATDVKVSADAVPPAARAILSQYRDITP